MGTIHKVEARGTWNVPTGARATGGAAIVEQVSNTHFDTVGGCAQMINNIYEHLKPPLIFDYYTTVFTEAGGSAVVKARYKVPVHHIGTGSNEGLIFSYEAFVSGGATGSIRLTTPRYNKIPCRPARIFPVAEQAGQIPSVHQT